MSFSISSPGLEDLAGAMDGVDVVTAYHRAAAEVGRQLEGPLSAAFKEADASEGLLSTLGTYISPDGTAYVGIPGTSRHAEPAHEIEYGTPFIPPRAPVRNTVAAHGEDFGALLTAALDREMGVELDGGPA